MTLHSLEFPDDPERLAASLEDILCSENLAELVAELRAVAADDPASLTLEQVLGPQRDALLTAGFSALTPQQTRLLLQHPQLLLELQELVYSHGGEHWTNRLSTAANNEAARQLWPGIAGRLEAPSQIATDPGPAPSRRRVWLAIVAAAAVVLIAGLLSRPGDRTIAWGWARPGVFDAPLERAPYLEHLADTANEWFAKSPPEPAALARRIQEFRQGCEQLLAASHSQLPADDREWLLERCRVWTDKIDQSLLDLEQDRKPADAVRGDMNEMTNKLMAALRQRASTA